MLVRQSKNTFVRFYDGKAYITNQLTRYDRYYNETGADFLKEISRQERDVDDIISSLKALYGDSVNQKKLSDDFLSFVNDLEKNFFLVTGSNIKECDSKDIDFSYSLGNMKTKIYDFTQPTETEVVNNTQDYGLEADQRNPILKSIQFEITSRCNERCIHCYIPTSKKDKGKDMSFEQFCKIIDEFADMGGLHVSLSGGEVFLHHDIIKMIRYCREKDMEICILSNLVTLKDIQIPFIKAANVSYIQVSLYSMTPEIHDAITTVKGSFIRTKLAIEKLIKANIPIQISCPLMNKNKDCYREVLEYAKSLNIKVFSDFILMAQADLSTHNLENRLSIEDTEKIIRQIIEFDLDYSKWVKEKRPLLETIETEKYRKQPICGVGINNFCVSENGDVYPCPGWQSYIVGNVKKQSLQNIWNKSSKLSSLRRITQSDFPKCISCDARNFCTRCLERNYNEHQGDMFKISKHLCDVAFLTKRIHEEYEQRGLL